MAIKFRQFNFKDGNPYAGGPCVLDDGSVVWAAVSDEDDGKGGKIAKLILLPLEVDDRRPTVAPKYWKPRPASKRRT
jgi:hypothetical protein